MRMGDETKNKSHKLQKEKERKGRGFLSQTLVKKKKKKGKKNDWGVMKSSKISRREV